MKKKVLCVLWALTASALCASPLDDADVAFYVQDYQKTIDIVLAEEASAAQQSFLAACRIRRAAAALALAADGQEAVMTDKEGEEKAFSPEETVEWFGEISGPEFEEAGAGRVDFWNYAALCSFFTAKYYAEKDPALMKEALTAADEALSRSARMSAHNKQLWYFASLVYGDSDFDPEFHNVSFAVSFMRRYLMISGQEADVLGLNRLSVLLRKRNFTLEEKRAALVEINKNLRQLSDPYKKYRYVEGYMPTTCWYNYASNHVFKNVSDQTEADLIDVYLKRKINPNTEIGAYIELRLDPAKAAEAEAAKEAAEAEAASEAEILTEAVEGEISDADEQAAEDEETETAEESGDGEAELSETED